MPKVVLSFKVRQELKDALQQLAEADSLYTKILEESRINHWCRNVALTPTHFFCLAARTLALSSVVLCVSWVIFALKQAAQLEVGIRHSIKSNGSIRLPEDVFMSVLPLLLFYCVSLPTPLRS